MNATRRKKNEVQLVASGDLRLSANQVCWPAQAAMEKALGQPVETTLHDVRWGADIQVAYAKDAAAGDECLFAKAAFARALGLRVNLCGTRDRKRAWNQIA